MNFGKIWFSFSFSILLQVVNTFHFKFQLLGGGGGGEGFYWARLSFGVPVVGFSWNVTLGLGLLLVVGGVVVFCVVG